MVTKLMVIQRISNQKKVEVFQVTGDYFQWTYETARARLPSDAAYYPFVINGKNKIWKRSPGAETKLIVKPEQIIFKDDYGVPEGTVIGILFPPGFIPDIIKFKDKPYIPVGFGGLVVARAPGHIQVLYNYHEKQAAVIFHINDYIAFGFKCIAKKVPDERFPRTESIYADDLFDVSLSREFLEVDAIHTDDLKIINQTVEQKTDTAEIKNLMNELLQSIKKGDKPNSQTLLNKISTILTNSVGTASGLVTLMDSYNAGGASFQFIHKVLQYVVL